MEPESSWSVALADFIRNNDQSLQEASKKVLTMFQDQLLPCETLAEFCDVAGNAAVSFVVCLRCLLLKAAAVNSNV